MIIMYETRTLTAGQSINLTTGQVTDSRPVQAPSTMVQRLRSNDLVSLAVVLSSPRFQRNA